MRGDKNGSAKKTNNKFQRKTLLVSDEKKFIVHCLIGSGSFADVYKVEDLFSDDKFAVKIYRFGPSYTKSALNEIEIFRRISKYTDTFVRHHCELVHHGCIGIVQELLGDNLYEILRTIAQEGLGHHLTKIIGRQLLSALKYLEIEGITHCDIKPKNICIHKYGNNNFQVKIVDFGSAFVQPRRNHFYVQSRYYRAPEAILGIDYGRSIDLWSFACVLFEVFTGEPLFPGKDNFELILRHIKLLGMPSSGILDMGKNTEVYFRKKLPKGVDERETKSIYSSQMSENTTKNNIDEQCVGVSGNYELFCEAKQGYNNMLNMTMFERKIKDLSKQTIENISLMEFILSILHFNSFDRADIDSLKLHPYLSTTYGLSSTIQKKEKAQRNIARKYYEKQMAKRKLRFSLKSLNVKERTKQNSSRGREENDQRKN